MEQHRPVAASEPGEDAPVIKAETLKQFREMMAPAAVREIYAAVVADLDKRIAALQCALKAGDSQEIRRIGHSIKGGRSMAGAVQTALGGAQLGARREQ